MENSLPRRVLDELITGIVGGKYQGALPPQDVLARQFGVCRTVLREALSMLISRRVLDIRTKRGTLIMPMCDWPMVDEEVVQWRLRANPDPAFLRDLAGFWALVAPAAAAHAALRASDHERAAIRAACTEVISAKNEQASRRAGAALRGAIVKASGHQILRQMAGLVCAAQPTGEVTGEWPTAIANAEREILERLAGSIESRDAAGAALAMADLTGDARGDIPQELLATD